MGSRGIQRRTAILVFSLIFIIALGMGIRQLWSEGVFANSKVSINIQPDKSNPSSAKETGSTQKTPDLSQDDENLITQFQEDTEDAQTEQQSEESISESEFAPQEIQNQVEEVAQNWQEPQMNQGFGNMQNMWADLNLTEEEQGRLQEGFRLAMERWQNMSDEERQIQMERMREGWERWQNMSEEERQEVGRQMRDRFEDWRRSGSIELPEMTLD